MTVAPVRPAGRGRVTSRPVLEPDELLPIAEGLAATAHSWPDLHDPTRRAWRKIAVGASFEAFLISWPTGGSIELHGHGGSAGAVVVTAGDLVETTARPGIDGGVVTTTRSLAAGSRVVFGPGDVHDIANHGPGPALSVHVYSPVLSTMTFFEQRGDTGLVPVRSEAFADGAAGR